MAGTPRQHTCSSCGEVYSGRRPRCPHCGESNDLLEGPRGPSHGSRFWLLDVLGSLDLSPEVRRLLSRLAGVLLVGIAIVLFLLLRYLAR
jgi:hypothetical protein